MVKLFNLVVVCMLIGTCGQLHAADSPGLTRLRCEYLVDPLGLGETSPRLSWVMQGSQRGDHQVAYQILVASTPQLLGAGTGDLWDTGKVDSDHSTQVVYAGKPLVSRMNCFWKVRVWSASGEPSDWSPPAQWSMGLLQPSDWKAQWIDNRRSAESAAMGLNILHAVYGPALTTPGSKTPASKTLDVTLTLQKQIKNGTLRVEVTNEKMGGDPDLQVVKQLVVDYQLGGKTLQINVPEFSTLSLPLDTGVLNEYRKTFAAKSVVHRATLYVTALGLYEAHLNGQRVGDHVLAPDWTDFNKRVRYQAYDVTALIKPGQNVLGAILANGWYAGHLGNGGFHEYGTSPALLAQLEINYADGSTDTIASDSNWKTHPSEILSSDFMLGETCDARDAIAGWDQPEFDETGWDAASVRDLKTPPLLESQVSPPVRETGSIKPIKLTEPAPGRWTFDLGQNMVGVVRLKVAASAGTVITIHHAEMLNPDGTIYTTNLRGAPSIDTYTCRGGGVETWQPKFTFHGFRYVEVTGLPAKPADDLITGIVLGSDIPRGGSFTCSDPRVNQLFSNIQWGQRGNYLSVPTDCPQRDERLGWMGDAEVFVRTATCNADVASFFTKWLVDVDDAQEPDGAFTDVSPARGTGSGTPAWGDAGVICPWTIYLAYGDKRLLQQNLPAMTKWVDWCRNNSTNLIRGDTSRRGGDYGDWLSIKADTPKDLIATAYFAYSTHLLAKSYAAVGNTVQAAKYEKLFDDIKSAFDKRYVTHDGRVTGDTQCCYAMALKFDLLPENLRTAAGDRLVHLIKNNDWHLSTGFVGVSYLLPMLTQTGHADVAYKLLLQDTFPSWLFSVKHGATTIWERWDGWTPDKGFQDAGMNSFNHYSLGSCGEWLYDTVAGITWDPEHPGYKHIIIKPQPGQGLSFASANIDSPYGDIRSGWTKDGENLAMKITLPANTTATVYVPVQTGQTVTESGKPAAQAEGVTFLKSEQNADIYEVQSGSYDFATGK